MTCTFEEYIADVKSQLTCNTSYEERISVGSYNYTEEQVDLHLDYFKDCLSRGLSGYKALLFFSDIL